MSDSFKTAAICIGAGIGVAVLTRYIQSLQDQLKESQAQQIPTAFAQEHVAESKPAQVHHSEPVVSHANKVKDIEDLPQFLDIKYHKSLKMERCHSDASTSTQATAAVMSECDSEADPVVAISAYEKPRVEEVKPASTALPHVAPFSTYYTEHFKAVHIDYSHFTRADRIGEVHSCDHQGFALEEFIEEWLHKPLPLLPTRRQVHLKALAEALERDRNPQEMAQIIIRRGLEEVRRLRREKAREEAQKRAEQQARANRFAKQPSVGTWLGGVPVVQLRKVRQQAEEAKAAREKARREAAAAAKMSEVKNAAPPKKTAAAAVTTKGAPDPKEETKKGAQKSQQEAAAAPAPKAPEVKKAAPPKETTAAAVTKKRAPEPKAPWRFCCRRAKAALQT